MPAIPERVKMRTEKRILEYAAKHHAGRFIRIDVRFRGALCYIDAYQEPDARGAGNPPQGETLEQWLDQLRKTPTPLCRIRYCGNEDRWSFAWYTWAHEKYQEGFLITGDHYGTPEEAFETVAHFPG